MKPLPLIAIVVVAIACASAVGPRGAHAQSATAPFTVAETGRGYRQLQDAVNAIGNGEGTVVIASGRWPQCAVQEAGRITYRAAVPGTAALDSAACEDKAALVLRGRGATVEGMTFQNIKVFDSNGAGIRLEQGDLTVSESLFRDSQQGILSGDDPRGTIRIQQSTFAGLGRCDGDDPCAHSVYIGHYGRVIVEQVRFERGRGGHYLKSRAAVNEVRDNSFDDTAGRDTNYMVDLCAGSVGTVAGNEFVVGRNKENHTAIIAVAAEARENRSAGLQVAGNTARLAPGVDFETTFVADWSHEALAIGQNRLGPGIKISDRR
jgi:hypothetical protein